MGNDGSRVIQVQDISDKLSQCILLQQKKCPVYGNVHYVRYQDKQFYLGQSIEGPQPHPMSLHYLIPPNLLLISQFTLLETISPSSLDNLLQIISSICQMILNGGIVGVGYKRIAYAGRWGVVGEGSNNWAYQTVFQGGDCQGVFLSPQLMTSLSEGRNIPRHNAEKSDVFALGIMIVQMIFQDKLGQIFDYQNFEINLKPLLHKLCTIRQEYGDQIYQIFLSMLQIQENQRASFTQIYEMVEQVRRGRAKMNNSRMTSSNHSRDMQRGNRTPTRGGRPSQNVGGRSPVRQYANNLSPFRARPGPKQPQTKRQSQLTGRTPQNMKVRQQQTSRSPLRRDLKINTNNDFARQSSNYNTYGMNENRRPLSPISRR